MGQRKTTAKAALDPAESLTANASLTALKGVGPRRAAALSALGLETIADLLMHFPRRYEDRRNIVPVKALPSQGSAVVQGRVKRVALQRFGGKKTVLRVRLEDATGVAEALYFNQPYRRETFEVGKDLVLAGQAGNLKGKVCLINPEAVPPVRAKEIGVGQLVPFYPRSSDLPQSFLRRLISEAVRHHGSLLESLDLPGLDPQGRPWLDREDALRICHSPQDYHQLKRAQLRFCFEELYSMQVLLARRKASFQERGTGERVVVEDGGRQTVVDRLPFVLTPGQTRALDTIAKELSGPHPMYRLLHGDVGSGKTAVALVAAALVAQAGFQCAFMAPTEVLAEQSKRVADELLAPLESVRTVLLLGRLTRSEHRAARDAVSSGDATLVIGTQAMISDRITFNRLGLVIVDEEHRFGVRQRDRLRGKGPAPHVLVMSATPIPRTLALTAYGDLDISLIPDQPPGRKPPRTHLVPREKRAAALRFLRRQVENGGRAFVVCPAVEAGPDPEQSAVRVARDLLSGALEGIEIGLLHGRLTSGEKRDTLEKFRRGTLQVLVATTVVEVGIDVPTADVMVIQGPDRFGLAQLHQLRGRVGRGGQVSYCLLMLNGNEGEEAIARVTALERMESGFDLAETDLKLRGPGEVLGVRQHGLPRLGLADPRRDVELLAMARASAFGQLGLQVEPAFDTD